MRRAAGFGGLWSSKGLQWDLRRGDARLRRHEGHGFSADGAGLAIGDLDRDSAQDLILMSYDDPGNDDDRDNNFKLRVVFAGGER